MFIKKILIFFTFLFVLFVSNGALAQTSGGDCGLNEDGTIDQTSFAICKEDIIYNAINSLFPIIIKENVFKFLNLKYLENTNQENIPENNYENYKFLDLNKHIIIVGLFKIANASLAVVISAILIIVLVKNVIYDTARTGSFLGDDVNLLKTGINYALFAILMAPIGAGITLIQFLFVLMGFVALGLANFFYSFYLNYVSGDFFLQQQNVLSASEEMAINNNALIYSNQYATSLINGALCNRATSQYIFETNFGDINPSNIQGKIDCVFSGQNKIGVNFNVDAGSESFDGLALQNISVSPFSSGDVDFINSSYVFGRNSPTTGQCSNYKSFNCLTIDISLPTLTEPLLTEMQEKADVFGEFKKIIPSLSIRSDNYASIKAGWDNIYSKINDEYKNENGDLNINQERAVKAVSLFYHQLIMNYLMIGYLGINKQGVSNIADGATNVSPFRDLLSEVTQIVDNIERAECNIAGYGMGEAFDTKEILNDYLAGEGDKNYVNKSLSTMRCVNFIDDGFQVAMDKEYEFNNLEDREQASAASNNYINQAIDQYNNLVEIIYNNKVSVNRSLQESLSEINSNAYFKDLRKKGFFAIGFSALEIAKKNDMDSKFRQYIDKVNFSQKTGFNFSNYLSKQITSDRNEYQIPNYRGFSVADALSDYSIRANEELIGQRNDYMNSVTNSFSDPASTGSEGAGAMESAFNLMYASFSDLEGTLFNITGAKMVFGTKEEIISENEECLQDGTCTAEGIKNPIINLTEFGHDLINVTSIMIASAFVPAAIVKIKKDAINNKSGSLNNKSFFQGGFAVFEKLIYALASFVSFILNISFIFLILGFMLAYFIPLMPFIKFLVEILSWVVAYFLAVLIANFWLIFLLLPAKAENLDDVKEALKTYLIQLNLRPGITVIAFIIVWMLLTVFMLLINYLFAMVTLSLVSASPGWQFVVSIMMVLVTYIGLIYLIFKYVVDLIEFIPRKITESLGASGSQSSSALAALILAKSGNMPKQKINSLSSSMRRFAKGRGR